MAEADVLVAGAGPTGQVTALWLTAQGVKVRIIDKASGPGETSRATVVHARTLELYRQVGMGDAVAAAGHKVTSINMWAGGRRRARVPFGNAGVSLTPYPFVLIHPQDLHERFLIHRLTELGVQVERQTELVDFSQDHDTVTARLRGPDGSIRSCTALYLAGCDGANSTVRRQLGAGFEGGTYEHLFYVADVEVRSDPLKGEMHAAFEGPDFMLVMPYGPPGRFRFVGAVRSERAGKAGPLTFDDVGHDTIEMLGLDISVVNWFSTYHVHHRVTDHFRHGRAFLLGDAAHIHSPVGGQGMNTGIGDAINLAWKLAAVLKGNANDSLIDSFEAERPVFARKLVETTDRAFTFVVKQGSVAGFVRNHVAPVFLNAVSGFESAREALFRLVSQIMINYPGSPLSAGTAGRVSGGDRLPYVRFDDRDNYAPLSTIGWQVHVYGAASPQLQAWCSGHELPLHEFPWHDAFGEAGLARNALYLLRPDSYVGLADAHGDCRAVEAYVSARGIRLG